MATTRAAKELERWCAAKRGRAAMLADALQVRPTAVHKWRTGKSNPEPSKRTRIEELTGAKADAWGD